jgi:MscS family membrane protein
MLAEYFDILFNKLKFAVIEADMSFVEVILKITALLIIASFLSILISNFLLKIHSRAKVSNNYIIQIVIVSIEAPMHALIWITGLYNALLFLPNSLSKVFVHQIQTGKEFLIEGLIGWFLIRLVDGMSGYARTYETSQGKQIDRTLISAISKILKLIIVLTISIMMLDSLGIRVTGLITFAGIGTAAIGFASKDLFSNYLGTVVIFFDKPFSVGEWINLPEKQIEGIVEEINWRMTKIKTIDHRMLYVPNNYFYNTCIENNSKINSSTIKLLINVHPKDLDKVSKAVAKIKIMLNELESIDYKQETVVCLDNLSPHSPVILIDCSVRTKDYTKIKHLKEEILTSAIKIIKSLKMELYFYKS